MKYQFFLEMMLSGSLFDTPIYLGCVFFLEVGEGCV